MQAEAMMMDSKWYSYDYLYSCELVFSCSFLPYFFVAISLNSVDMVKYPKAINNIFSKMVLLEQVLVSFSIWNYLY